MRILATLLTFLVATGVAAQVVSPIEQSYGPYRRGFDGYEPALAVSRDAVLLAWSEIVSDPQRTADPHRSARFSRAAGLADHDD